MSEEANPWDEMIKPGDPRHPCPICSGRDKSARHCTPCPPVTLTVAMYRAAHWGNPARDLPPKATPEETARAKEYLEKLKASGEYAWNMQSLIRPASYPCVPHPYSWFAKCAASLAASPLPEGFVSEGIRNEGLPTTEDE